MILLINQTPVDLTLETEKTLGDLVSSLFLWAAQNDLSPVGILVDGRAYHAALASSELTGVARVEFEAVGQDQAVLSQLRVLSEYFTLALDACRQNDGALLRDLQSEFPSVRPRLAELGVALPGLERPWDTRTTAGELELARVEVMRSLRERENPRQGFVDALNALGPQLAEVGSLASLWQKGQDKVALDWIRNLMATLEVLNRTAAGALLAARSEFSWSAWQVSVQPFLEEVEVALGAGDFVLVNDLLEYEVSPRLAALRERLGDDFVLDRAATAPLE